MERYESKDRRKKSSGRSRSRRDRDKDRERSHCNYKDRDGDHRMSNHGFEKAKIRASDHKGKERESIREHKDNDVDKQNNIADQDLLVGANLSALELEARIRKAKEERLTEKKMKTSEEVDCGEVLTWVRTSRKMEEKKNAEKVKALQLSKVFEEQDKINIIGQGEEISEDEEETCHDHPAGVKVLHGLDKVIEGGAVVLTLKDQNILLADGHGINEDTDMLENVEIGEQMQRDEAYKAGTKKMGIFNHGPAGLERKILPQYDEPIPASEEGLTLDESGGFTGEAEKKLEELHRRIQQGVSNSTSNCSFEDLNNISRETTSDFYTHEEIALRFKKPKKKKSLRIKKEKLDIDVLEAEAASAGLGVADLGSRNDAKRQAIGREEQERLEAERRNNAYQVAYAKADEVSKSLQKLGQNILSVKTDQEYHETSLIFADDNDEDLYKSLERARKLALKKKDEEEAASDTLQEIALLATSASSKTFADDDQNRIPSRDENKVVFTEMNEFVWGLHVDEAQCHIQHKSKDIFNMPEDAEEPKAKDDIGVGGWTEVKDDIDHEDKEHPAAAATEDYKVKDDVPDGTIREVAIGKGLSGVLKLLKERGTFKVEEDIEVLGITDESGRPLTQKEAFKRFSHRFHGKEPGKMKQEKCMKHYENELKLKQMQSSDTPSRSMERVREAQAALHTPCLVLSGHAQPNQTVDILESDQPLRMLHDRKRKTEPESSGTRKKPRT